MSIQNAISCDNCRTTNISLYRYKCLICSNYNLCFNCYDYKLKHSQDHPMQLILTEYDYEQIYYGKYRMKTSLLALTCSLCNQNGFSLELLIKHLDEKHKNSNLFRLCPICFRREKNLSKHLQDEHLQTKKIIFHSEEKHHHQGLLGEFIRKSSIQYEYQERNRFLHYLLTDLVNREI